MQQASRTRPTGGTVKALAAIERTIGVTAAEVLQQHNAGLGFVGQVLVAQQNRCSDRTRTVREGASSAITA